jgi:hypothetical protein
MRATVALVVSVLAVLGIAAAPAGAAESLGVKVVTDGTFHGAGDIGASSALLTALYVDNAGTAHVAYADPDSWDVDLCTIPSGATACTPAGVLHTDGTTFGEPIESMKYLADGNGSAILALGFTLLGTSDQPHPSFDPAAQAPYSETEVFLPGSTTGIAIGDLYDAGGEVGGDEISVPNGNGLDIVGVDQSIVESSDISPANSYQFESFTSPAAADSPPMFLGVQTAGVGHDAGEPGELPGEWPLGVTLLGDGQTAVLAANITTSAFAMSSYYPGNSAIGMFVQPAGGGAFGPIQQLGISGPVETDFAPSQGTYLINVESGVKNGVKLGLGPFHNEPMELHDFRGTSLQSLGTIGTTQGPFDSQSEWDTLPPSSEDSAGDLYVAWIAADGFDGCPPSPPDTPASSKLHNPVDGCLIYRRIAPGGLFGPKIVLSEAFDHQPGAGYVVDALGDPDQIAANAAGAGWVLVWRGGVVGGTGTPTLYAQPLASSGGLSAAPTVSGATTTVPLTCAGAGSGTCAISASVDSSSSMAMAAKKKPKARTIVYASAHFSLKGGAKHKLVLRLDKAGKRLLAHRHTLTVALVVTQEAGVSTTPTPIFSGHLKLHATA